MGCAASAPVEPLADSIRSKRTQFHAHYLLGPKVGRGAFAQVRLVTKAGLPENDQTPKAYEEAVKIMDLRDKECLHLMDKDRQRAAQTEAMVWRKVCKHPNVVHLVDAFWGKGLCYLVMERCDSVLVTALQKEDDLNEQTLGYYVHQMAQGMAHVHSAGVVHRDLKPDNFLVGGPNGNQVKLADFGLSAMLPKNGSLRGIHGTAPFMCPEMIGPELYDEKADLWSFGVILYVFLFGSFPYMPRRHGSEAMKAAIWLGSPSPAFEPSSGAGSFRRSDSAMQVVQALLMREPSKRPTAAELLQMPYMLQASGSPGALPWPHDMPSLRPSLLCARKIGAFDCRDIFSCDDTDVLLKTLQMKHHNARLPNPERYSAGRHSQEHCVDSNTKGVSKLLKTNKLSDGNSSPISGNPDHWDSCSTRGSKLSTLASGTATPLASDGIPSLPASDLGLKSM